MNSKTPNDSPQNDITTTSYNVSRQNLKVFLRHLANGEKSKNTLKVYSDALSLFLGSFDWRDPAEITPDLLDEFFEDLGRRRSAATVNLYKSAVRQFYRHLLETEKVARDPSRLIRNKKIVRKSPETFSGTQLETLLDKIAGEIGARPKFGPMRDWMMIELAYYTGLRVGELVRLDVPDVEGKTALEVIGKGNKLAKIPLNEKVQLALRKYVPWRKALRVEDRKALFLNRFGRRISRRAVEMNFKKWLKKAKIEGDFSPHSLRHTFGTNILRATKNIRVAQELLRHAHVTTTQIYTHVDDGEKRSAVESLE